MYSRILDTAELGRAVRNARKQQGLTQEKFASMFNSFSREFLSDLENGKPTVEFEKALKVANLLGLRLFINSVDNRQLPL
jgi:transcriptional regulator with XRE-family HTH domain